MLTLLNYGSGTAHRVARAGWPTAQCPNGSTETDGYDADGTRRTVGSTAVLKDDLRGTMLEQGVVATIILAQEPSILLVCKATIGGRMPAKDRYHDTCRACSTKRRLDDPWGASGSVCSVTAFVGGYSRHKGGPNSQLSWLRSRGSILGPLRSPICLMLWASASSTREPSRTLACRTCSTWRSLPRHSRGFSAKRLGGGQFSKRR